MGVTGVKDIPPCQEGSTCAVIGATCGGSSECCSNNCVGGTCQEGTGPCLPIGESCTGAGACCSLQCEVQADGTSRCVGDYTCRPAGEVCSDPDDCCTMACQAGICVTLGNCGVVGIPCTGFRECCSGACAESGMGTPTCQYLSGCRPIGEICLGDADCCSTGCDPSADYPDILRCQHPAGCLADGEVCWTGSANNCCSGRRNCRPTLAGVSRCYGTDEGSCTTDLQPCSFTDECCCGLCAPDAAGALVCCPAGEICIPDGGRCTTDADCCGWSCVDGVCGGESPCVPLSGPCETAEDCCSGDCDPTTHSCTPLLL